VFLIALPCESDPKDLEDANRVAVHLGVDDVSVYSLDTVFSVMKMSLRFGELDAMSQTSAFGIAVANIKARLRMVALYTEANLLNYLVIGTGNKSEHLIGYFTKWGDGGVDLEPLGEFYKTEVVEMARELGLPEDICTRVPSPGLQEGVTDESEIGMSYDELDEVLRTIGTDKEVPYASKNPEIYSKVVDMIRGSEHKRLMPPMFKR